VTFYVITQMSNDESACNYKVMYVNVRHVKYDVLFYEYNN